MKKFRRLWLALRPTEQQTETIEAIPLHHVPVHDDASTFRVGTVSDVLFSPAFFRQAGMLAASGPSVGTLGTGTIPLTPARVLARIAEHQAAWRPPLWWELPRHGAVVR